VVNDDYGRLSVYVWSRHHYNWWAILWLPRHDNYWRSVVYIRSLNHYHWWAAMNIWSFNDDHRGRWGEKSCGLFSWK
jgi:hypothetical protein